MADIQPPSFSLGLDLDLDFDLPCQVPDSPTSDTSAPPENKNESLLPVTDPRPIFRRLRRGPRLSNQLWEPLFSDFNVEDDIEEFSPEELQSRPDEQTAAQVQSVCSGTKFSLHGRGVVTKQPVNEPCRKRKQDLDAPSTSSIADKGKRVLTDMNRSPLRRFQLLDSDSDDMCDFEDAGVGIKLTNKRESNLSCSAAAAGKTSDPPAQFSQKIDFWKDFRLVETCNVSTPALDEFCQEYFRASKDTKRDTDGMRGFCKQGGEIRRPRVGAEKLQQTDLGHALPPAHHYFFHDDPRIQRLVQSRLPHFQPLFPVDNLGNDQHNASPIDYRSQFNHETSSNQKSSTRANPKTSSTKAGSSSKSSRGKGNTNSAEEWINPKSTANVPKFASRRRVHASGGSVGQWHTNENGKKVYVSKSGQEFTGQSAYRCYKKESGVGFGKSKKKKPAAGRKKSK